MNISRPELDQMNWSARGNVLNQYLRNTSIGTTVKAHYHSRKFSTDRKFSENIIVKS